MILHALKVLENEVNNHFQDVAGAVVEDTVVLGNIATIETNGGIENANLFEKVLITLVNLREESTMRNGPYSRVNSTTLRTEYFNPPIHANLFLLFSATTKTYENGLLYLSRLIRYFQHKNVFTHENTAPVPGISAYDRLETFKFILEFYSPTFEELNHLWGTLGGKQYPSVLYKFRMLELEHENIIDGGPAIQEIDNQFIHKK